MSANLPLHALLHLSISPRFKQLHPSIPSDLNNVRVGCWTFTSLFENWNTFGTKLVSGIYIDRGKQEFNSCLATTEFVFGFFLLIPLSHCGRLSCNIPFAGEREMGSWCFTPSQLYHGKASGATASADRERLNWVKKKRNGWRGFHKRDLRW